MKAEELRIGNVVSYFGRQHTVRAIGNGNVTIGIEGYKSETVSINSISPILLTEEWLIKFGFEKIDVLRQPNFLLYRKKSFDSFRRFRYDSEGLSIETVGSGFIWHLPKIKYVHQLQNLYFALTGKEL